MRKQWDLVVLEHSQRKVMTSAHTRYAGSGSLGSQRQNSSEQTSSQTRHFSLSYILLASTSGIANKSFSTLFKTDLRVAERIFSPVKVVKQWHRPPRKAVDAWSLEVFKARCNEALSNLI